VWEKCVAGVEEIEIKFEENELTKVLEVDWFAWFVEEEVVWSWSMAQWEPRGERWGEAQLASGVSLGLPQEIGKRQRRGERRRERRGENRTPLQRERGERWGSWLDSWEIPRALESLEVAEVGESLESVAETESKS
jgi:hypothetical protein